MGSTFVFVTVDEWAATISDKNLRQGIVGQLSVTLAQAFNPQPIVLAPTPSLSQSVTKSLAYLKSQAAGRSAYISATLTPDDPSIDRHCERRLDRQFYAARPADAGALLARAADRAAVVPDHSRACASTSRAASTCRSTRWTAGRAIATWSTRRRRPTTSAIPSTELRRWRRQLGALLHPRRRQRREAVHHADCGERDLGRTRC